MQFYKGAEVFSSINHKLSEISKAHTQPYIRRVHKHLRDVNKKAYEPQIIAIGPYHHGKDSLKRMEEHKLRYLRLLLKRRKENVERYISAIGPLEQQARSCYSEPISLSVVEFVEMLVLDGCFIIELLRKYDNPAFVSNDPIFQVEWIFSALSRDLILFENQIPFFILFNLFELIEAPSKELLTYRLTKFFQNPFTQPGLKMSLRRQWEVVNHAPDLKHLLDLIYIGWCPSIITTEDVAIDMDNIDKNIFNKREMRFINSARELRGANVEFKKKESYDSFFEVKFENGIMEMPPLSILDETETLFRNFIVYEQHFPNSGHTIFTDYAIFLDRLINSSKDVKILSECGIIDNWMGDGQVVADIFNRMRDSVVGPNSSFYYAETFDRVNAHYKKSWNKSMAILKRDVFNSIWAYISFFVGFALLLLTLAQAVCSVLQVV